MLEIHFLSSVLTSLIHYGKLSESPKVWDSSITSASSTSLIQKGIGFRWHYRFIEVEWGAKKTENEGNQLSAKPVLFTTHFSRKLRLVVRNNTIHSCSCLRKVFWIIYMWPILKQDISKQSKNSICFPASLTISKENTSSHF